MIVFNVTKDKVSIKQDDTLNRGEYNVTKCKFLFSKEYDGLVKEAIFFIEEKNIGILLDENDECNIPQEAFKFRGNIEIGLYAYYTNNNKLEKRYSPSRTTKVISDGSYTSEIDNTEEITPTDKEQMNSIIKNNVEEIKRLSTNKVDKVEGYGLSKNDFTDTLKSKLDEIDESADVNLIESISINGTNIPIIDKNVDVIIPTKTSDLSNDSDFTTNNHVDNVKDYLEEKIDENTQTIGENADAIEELNDNLLNYSLINETGNKIQLLMDTSTYKIKAILKDKNNNTIDTSNEIDLPMESVVLNVTYNSTDKELVITLQNGSITRVSLTSLISGLVNEDTLESTLEDYVLVSDYNAAISNLETGKADKSTTYTKNEVDQLLIDGNYNFATFELDIDTGELYLRKTDDMLLQFNIDENGYLEVII